MRMLDRQEIESVAGGDECTAVAWTLGGAVGGAIADILGPIVGGAVAGFLGDFMSGACGNPDSAAGSRRLEDVSAYMNGA